MTSSSTTAALPMSGLRRAVDRAQPLLIALFALAVVSQITIAGGAAFGLPAWPTHVMVGMGIELIALLVLGAALIARGRVRITSALVAFVLATIQPVAAVLAERSDPVFGLIHGLCAALLLAHVAGLAVGTLVRDR